MTNRISETFATCRSQNRAALVTFIVAADPNPKACADLLAALPEAGADIIELGMPFSDPMADGPVVEAAGLRALKAGGSMQTTLKLVRDFRKLNDTTPLVLMGYFNPILNYGLATFAQDAANAGVDGVIIVDLPPEEDAEMRRAAEQAGLSIIRLATPTTDAERLPAVLEGASGFVYYVSVAGVTGVRQAVSAQVAEALAAIRPHTELPLAVGFGIRSAEQVKELAPVADAVVVGSAVINRIIAHLDAQGHVGAEMISDVTGFVRELASATRRT